MSTLFLHAIASRFILELVTSIAFSKSHFPLSLCGVCTEAVDNAHAHVLAFLLLAPLLRWAYGTPPLLLSSLRLPARPLTGLPEGTIPTRPACAFTEFRTLGWSDKVNVDQHWLVSCLCTLWLTAAVDMLDSSIRSTNECVAAQGASVLIVPWTVSR